MTPVIGQKYRNARLSLTCTVKGLDAKRVLIVVEGNREWLPVQDFLAKWKPARPLRVV